MNLEIRRMLIRAIRMALLIIQLVLVVLLIHSVFIDFSSADGTPQENMSFDQWYGNWMVAATTTIGLLLAVFLLTKPRKPKEWKGVGVIAAFFISLFTEMYGIPLTIYLLAPILGVEPKTFGMYESHLWAYLLSRAGLMPLETGVNLVMLVSTALVVLGFSLLAFGWKKVYRGRGQLVTTGLYTRLRHPQYLGLILIVVAFLIMWPTLLTILLAPFLIVRYFLLAKDEDRELEQNFGDQFTTYKDNVPAFIPSLRGKPCGPGLQSDV